MSSRVFRLASAIHSCAAEKVSRLRGTHTEITLVATHTHARTRMHIHSLKTTQDNRDTVSDKDEDSQHIGPRLNHNHATPRHVVDDNDAGQTAVVRCGQFPKPVIARLWGTREGKGVGEDNSKHNTQLRCEAPRHNAAHTTTRKGSTPAVVCHRGTEAGRARRGRKSALSMIASRGKRATARPPSCVSPRPHTTPPTCSPHRIN